MTERKAKTCAAKDCGKTFYPFTTTERVCSIGCALVFASDKRVKEYKKETLEMRRAARLKDRGYQLGLAQKAFNAYIRERDKGLPCISCGGTENKMTAGHYKSAGAYPELRFEEDNCHGQCWYNCNSNRSGNIVEYRIGLIQKIGIERVEWLEGPHDPKNYTIDEIIEIKKKYLKKKRESTRHN